MWWYKGVYGSWNDPNGIGRIDGTSKYSEIKKIAKAIANEKNVVVTIIGEHGMKVSITKVEPD